MDFDRMLEIWRAQHTPASYDVNRDALRHSLQAEEARVRRELRTRRRGLWFLWMFGAGMAIWAGFWIAICITNGWPAIYSVAAGASLGLFALGVGAVWTSRGPRGKAQPDFGNTLQEEVRRNLALVEDQLSVTRHWVFSTLGLAAIIAGTALFNWTVNRSQDIPDSAFGWIMFAVVPCVFIAWASRKERDEMRRTRPTLERRQRYLRELLETLDTGE